MKKYKFCLKHPDDISIESKERQPGYVEGMEITAKKHQNEVFTFFKNPSGFYRGRGWNWHINWLIPAMGKNGQLLLDFGE